MKLVRRRVTGKGDGRRELPVAKKLKLKAAKEVREARRTIPRSDGGGSAAVAKWAKKLKVSESTINKWAMGQQLSKKFNGKLTRHQQEKISSLSLGGMSTKSIAKELGISISVIYVHKNKLRYQKSQPKDKVNEIEMWMRKWKRPGDG